MSTVATDPIDSANAISQGFIDRLEQQGSLHLIEHRGSKVAWRCFGKGSPLIMIHGGHGDWRHWLRNIEALATQHQVWLPDLPGFGESDGVDNSPHDSDRMQRLLDRLHATADILLGNTPVDLVAFSFGALVASQFARTHAVRRMSLIGPVGHGGQRRPHKELLNWRALSAEQRRAALQQNLGSLMLHDADAIDATTLAVYESQCQHTRFHAKSIVRTNGLPELLKQLDLPLLLIWGEHDPTAVPEQVAVQLATGRSNCEWRVIKDAGHWVQHERHEEVNALLLAWFGKP